MTARNKNKPDSVVDDYGETFSPEGNIFDYFTYEVVAYALKNNFTSPFHLRFMNADQGLFRESLITIEDGDVLEDVTLEASGTAQRFPLSCELADSEGRSHIVVISTEQMDRLMVAAIDSGQNIRFPAKTSNYSMEVFCVVRQMLAAAILQGLCPPFTIEIRDRSGRLFRTAEIYADRQGELRGGLDICDCAHLEFPLTVKLRGRSGAELARSVDRAV